MKRCSFAIAILLGGVVAASGACGAQGVASDVPDSGSGGDGGPGMLVPAGGDASDDAPDAPSSPPQAFLRIAQLSPDLSPVDVCVAPHGTTTFQGPLVAGLAGALAAADDAGEDGGAVGLSFAQVSAYVPLPPGQYDVRIVAAGATSCAAPASLLRPLGEADDAGDDGGDGDAAVFEAGAGDAALLDAGADGGSADAALADDAGAPAPLPPGIPDATDLPTLANDTYTTLIVAGDATPAGADRGITVAMIPDDAVLAGGSAVLRAVNAVPSVPALDFGLAGADAGWVALLTDVTFAAASAHVGPAAGALDANGYLPIAATSAPEVVSARASGDDAGADVAVAHAATVPFGSIATLVAVGGKTGDAAHPASLLLCIDNQPSGGLLSDCSVLP